MKHVARVSKIEDGFVVHYQEPEKRKSRPYGEIAGGIEAGLAGFLPLLGGGIFEGEDWKGDRIAEAAARVKNALGAEREVWVLSERDVFAPDARSVEGALVEAVGILARVEVLRRGGERLSRPYDEHADYVQVGGGGASFFSLSRVENGFLARYSIAVNRPAPEGLSEEEGKSWIFPEPRTSFAPDMAGVMTAFAVAEKNAAALARSGIVDYVGDPEQMPTMAPGLPLPGFGALRRRRNQ